MWNEVHEGAGGPACCLGAILGSTHVLYTMKVEDPECLKLTLDSTRNGIAEAES